MFEPDDVIRRVKTLRIVWMAMMLGLALYAGVTWALILRTGGPPRGARLSQTVTTYAAVIIVLALPLARVVRRKIEAVPPNATAEMVTARWVAGWITGQAVREGVGIAGVTLARLMGSVPLVWGFVAASVGSMLLAAPFEHELRLRLRRASTDPNQTAGSS